MDALLGFAVLTGPLWLILILLAAAFWVAAKVTTRARRRGAKIAAALVAFLVVALAPFADHIIGRVYFNYLCANEADARVYRKLALPADYWDERGRPRFLKQNGELDRQKLGARLFEPARSEPYSRLLGITMYRHQVVDRANQQMLGEVITFMFWGGWIARNLNPSPGAIGCESLRRNKLWNDFYMRLFTATTSLK